MKDNGCITETTGNEWQGFITGSTKARVYQWVKGDDGQRVY